MSLRSAVIIVVDRWGAGFLGPYGNTWLETPAMNHLAARSLLCETVLADSPRLETTYRSYWTGRHALEPAIDTALAAKLSERGVATALVTDEPDVADHPLAAGFANVIRVATHDAEAPRLRAPQCADHPAETGMARLFAAAADALPKLSPPYLLWIHARGMAGPWDAPREFREQFRDEEDPLPGDFAVPPNLRIGEDFDPDELLKVMHAYAGQVSLLDLQTAALWELLEARAEPELMLALTSPRGYPLGEHGRIGPSAATEGSEDDALYGELLHVPLLVQFPRGCGWLARTHELVQPADLNAAIAEHFELPGASLEPSAAAHSVLWQIAGNEDHLRREIAVAAAPNQRAIRTPAWFLRESRTGNDTRHELFAKPDDRWEINEVSSRCGQEMELLIAALDRFQEMAQAGCLAELAPLAESLRDTWR